MPEVAIGGGFALAGVVIGSVLSGLLELWRQVLNGRAAARIIEREIDHNISRCITSIGLRNPDFHLLGDAWTDYRIQLAPLLHDETLSGLTSGYGSLFIIERWMNRIGEEYNKARSDMHEWMTDMVIHSGRLKHIEKRSRVAQFFDLLLRPSTLPQPVTSKRRQEVKATLKALETKIRTTARRQDELESEREVTDP